MAPVTRVRPFEVVPAIDVKDGRCVRLVQGRFDSATVYGDDPVAVARRWAAAGAPRLHVVDLDGARAGRPVARDAVLAIVAAVKAPVQVGGGIRTRADLDGYLEAGIERVILGTAALEDRALVAGAARAHPGRVWVGLDVRDGRLAVRGWLETRAEDPLAAARALAADDVAGFVVTDVTRDGTLAGPTVDLASALALAVDRPVLASGGVASATDVRRLAAAAGGRLAGAIVGKALYAGTATLEALLAAATEAQPRERSERGEPGSPPMGGSAGPGDGSGGGASSSAQPRERAGDDAGPHTGKRGDAP